MSGPDGLTVRQLGGSLGAQITGIDLREPLSDSDARALHQAFLDHMAIFFPGQQLDPASMHAFVSRFGSPMIHPYLKSISEVPQVHELKKQPSDAVNFGNVWHTDFTNLELPSLANALYSVTVPPYGGDTVFMSMVAAYEALSPRLREILDGLDAVHGFSEKYKQDLRDQKARASKVTRDDDAGEDYTAAEKEVIHPVIRRHPETGRKALYVNPGFTLRFDGMTTAESKPLLDFLFRHCEKPEFGFRYSWQANTLGIWDNRCTMHYASNDYPGQFRHMYRMVVLEQERPQR